MPLPARFFDGEIALDHAVEVQAAADGLVFAGPDVPERRWSYRGLIAIESPQRGLPFRLTHESAQGARLVIAHDEAVADLIKRAPHLKGGINLHRVAKVTVLIAASLAATVFAGWLLLTFAPQQIAGLLPTTWVKKTGENIEKSLVEEHPRCTDAKGVAALAVFANRLKEGSADFPDIEIRVYSLGFVNAFALPGGHVILAKELIDAASSPAEVAGVLAHEIGHVSYKHPEAQMVRIMGVQVLLSLASGGGDTMGNAAGYLAILSYSRDAEREADAFARDLMVSAAIDPMGFKTFFETLQKQEGDAIPGAFGKLTSMLSTHPMTADRIAAIQPLPEGVKARPVLADADWQALRGICSSVSD